MSQAPECSMPLRIGAPDEFARARSLLLAAGFDDQTITRGLGGEGAPEVESLTAETPDLANLRADLALLVRLFLLGEPARKRDAARLLDADLTAALAGLDLLREAPSAPESYYSPVSLHPVGGLLIASDRQTSPDGSPFSQPPDAVLHPRNAGTLRFLKTMSKAPAADALDLCAGGGVAALVLGATVGRVISADVTRRATHFAQFNRLLNGRANVEVVEGDLYDPVRGRTFHRIVAHPPYMPALGDAVIYREGGETGEALVRRVVEGLPEFLRPGGTFYSMVLGRDTAEGPFEERARCWLGPRHAEFDIIFALGEEKSVRSFVAGVARASRGRSDISFAGLGERLGRAGTLKLAYGALVIHRRVAAAEPWTIRPELDPATHGSCFDWAFGWRGFSTRPDFAERLARLRPRLAPGLTLHVKHSVSGGELVPEEILLRSEVPFPKTTRIDARIVSLISDLGGRRTVAQLFEAARAAQADEIKFGDFAGLFATLIERGYLVVDEFPLPA
jgi:SAM-dependent methyltransferase